MAGEILVKNTLFALDSGWCNNNTARVTMGPAAVTQYLNGHRCAAAAQLYDTIFTDNNLTMSISYATVDNGSWYLSNSIAWEAINGTSAQQIFCANAHSGYLRWRVDWQATGGDGKTYVDWAKMMTFAGYGADMVTSPRHTAGKLLYKLASWNFTSAFPILSLNHGASLNTTCAIVAI